MGHVKEIFAFPGDIIIQQLHRSGLLRFDDSVNDLTFFSKLRVTSKGPNAIGATNDNNISTKYRGIYPSFLGRIDINVCGTSDPGSTRTLTPFCNTTGLYYSGENEPEDFKYKFDKDIDSYFRDENKIIVSPSFKSKEAYYDYEESSKDLLNEIRTFRKPKNVNKLFIEINISDDI